MGRLSEDAHDAVEKERRVGDAVEGAPESLYLGVDAFGIGVSGMVDKVFQDVPYAGEDGPGHHLEVPEAGVHHLLVPLVEPSGGVGGVLGKPEDGPQPADEVVGVLEMRVLCEEYPCPLPLGLGPSVGRGEEEVA